MNSGMSVERIHHAAVTVSDLDRSLDFYQNVLGAQLLHIGSSETQGVPLSQFQNIVQVKGAKLKFAFMRFGDTMFELIYYLDPKGRGNDRRHNDVGTHHLAFQVSDAEKTYRALSSKGVTFNSPPAEVRANIDGWCRGWKFTYFRGPDGEFLEIFQELH